MNDNEASLMNTDQAAVAMGVSVRWVRTLCESGKIGKRVGRNWILTLAEVDRFKKDHPSRASRKSAKPRATTRNPAKSRGRSKG